MMMIMSILRDCILAVKHPYHHYVKQSLKFV